MNSQTTNKYIVLTGGNSGIGLSALTQLYNQGYTIIFGARNEQKNKQVTQSLINTHSSQSSSNHGRICHFQLDLCQPKSIQNFVQNVQQKLKQYQNIKVEQLPHLDILINNAGICGKQGQLKIVNGVQVSVYANHFGHFYLTYLLYPLLRKAKKQARIINVGSNASQKVKRSTAQLAKDEYSSQHIFDLSCTQKQYNFLQQYSISKLFNTIFTHTLQQHINTSTHNKIPLIKVVCLHPGFVDTPFGNQNPTVKQIKTKYAQYMIQPSESKGIAILCQRKFEQLHGGEYYDEKGQLRKMTEVAADGSYGEKLWSIGEKMFGIDFKTII